MTTPAPPSLASFAEALYESLLPMQFAEPDNNYALANYLAGIGAAFQVVEDAGRDQGDIPGWASFMDANLCPKYALGWLAQFIGVTLDVGLSEADQRAAIKAAGGWKRGTPAAIEGAVAGYLTGSKSMVFRERYDATGAVTGDAPYSFEVVTYTSETPNPTLVQNALNAAKPAGLVVTYNVLAGTDYQTTYTNNANYQAIDTKYATYQDMIVAF